MRIWSPRSRCRKPSRASLRHGLVLQVGGARLDPATARRVHAELGWRLQQVYGMSEGLLCFTRLDDPEEVVFTPQGRPVAPVARPPGRAPGCGTGVGRARPQAARLRGRHPPRGRASAPSRPAGGFHGRAAGVAERRRTRRTPPTRRARRAHRIRRATERVEPAGLVAHTGSEAPECRPRTRP
ncbi:AMP-binding protein [Streptomyces sp. NBC_01186]|uniref:AMP-binding protein n=1 Tax=Streptomyces sp. NBC_01186 TaxID=2903765 RepID=UPI003FA6F210